MDVAEKHRQKYKVFPEFEKVVPDEIFIDSATLDNLADQRRRELSINKRSRAIMAGTRTTKRGWYPPEKRIAVATAFAAGMTNANDLEQLTGIAASTIRNWKQNEWWHDLLERIRHEQDEKFDAKFTKIIDKTLDHVMDSLQNGDHVLMRDGEIVRKPMSGKEAAQISSTIIDKRNLLRGKPTSRTESVSGKDRLSKLAEEFRKFSGAKTITVEKEPDGESKDEPIPLESGEEGGQAIYTEEAQI